MGLRKGAWAAALLGVATAAPALDFKPVLQADLQLGHETQASTAQDNFVWNGQLFFLPAVGLGPGRSLLPLFAVLRDNRDVVVEEDSASVERDSFLARPLYRQSLSPHWDLKAWGDARRAVTLESYQVPWSEGLYDYEEYGGGAGVTYRPEGPRLQSVDVGLELLHRGYPNWHEQGVSLTANANYYDKDYNGAKLTVSLLSPQGGPWSWRSDLTYLYRGYTDALLQTVNGYTPGSARVDHFAFWDSHWIRSQGAWSGDLGLELTADQSNEDYFDSNNSDPQFMVGFYDFVSEQLGLAVGYAPRGEAGPSARAEASLLYRTYSGRQIHDPDGHYAQGMEADAEQHYHVEGAWPLAWGLSLRGDVDYTKALSNQFLIGSYHPAYDLLHATAGLQYRL